MKGMVREDVTDVTLFRVLIKVYANLFSGVMDWLGWIYSWEPRCCAQGAGKIV
jgi:hypothetical protein